MKKDTSKFTNTKIFYDEKDSATLGFAFARGLWEGDERIGCRWYDDNGIGYPQTYGKPQWFILPKDVGKIIEQVLTVGRLIKAVSKHVI